MCQHVTNHDGTVLTCSVNGVLVRPVTELPIDMLLPSVSDDQVKAGFHIAPTTALQHCCNNRGVRAQVYLYNSRMLTTESIQQPQLYGNQPL